MVTRFPTSSPRQRARHEPLFDVHPQTGATIEVFYADRELETFGRCGSGWFWWSRRRGFSPDSLPTGPFATSYAAYRHAMGTGLGTNSDVFQNCDVKSDGYGDLLAEGEELGSNLLRLECPAGSFTLGLSGTSGSSLGSQSSPSAFRPGDGCNCPTAPAAHAHRAANAITRVKPYR